MKIGEFARQSQVSPKMLRHYDAIGLFSPSQIDPQNGYRFYHPKQQHTLKWILLLKHFDFSLSEIKHLISGPVDSAQLIQALAIKRIQIAEAFQQNLIKSLQLDELLLNIQQEGFNMEKNITLSSFSPDTILNIKKGMPNMDMLYEKAQALVTSALEGTTFGIIRIDLRQFKAVNDIDGYDVGDKVIVGLYQTLENTLSQYQLQSSIARAGGDEFLIFLQGDHNLIREVSHRFKAAMKAFDYKAIGCHKPIDLYMGVVLSNTSPQTHLRKLMDDTYTALIEAHHQIARGEEGIHIVEC